MSGWNFEFSVKISSVKNSKISTKFVLQLPVSLWKPHSHIADENKIISWRVFFLYFHAIAVILQIIWSKSVSKVDNISTQLNTSSGSLFSLRNSNFHEHYSLTQGQLSIFALKWFNLLNSLHKVPKQEHKSGLGLSTTGKTGTNPCRRAHAYNHRSELCPI